jgi:ribosomal protein S18 acetylase RimI-like enzyme
MEFRVVGAADEGALAELFADIDTRFFRPHPMTDEEAHRIATGTGSDVYAILVDDRRPVAYGMLRGWSEGFETPSLGVAVRTGFERRGYGRAMMLHLHAVAIAKGARRVRLRVHPDNVQARRLYESLSYGYDGEDRGELVMTLALETNVDSRSGQGDRLG